jgi:hypothetical protein
LRSACRAPGTSGPLLSLLDSKTWLAGRNAKLAPPGCRLAQLGAFENHSFLIIGRIEQHKSLTPLAAKCSRR